MYQCEVYKMVERDVYETGCGDSQDFGLIETLTARSITDLVSMVKHSYCFKDAETFENRIEVQVTEDDQGYKPTNAQIEKWKNNEFDLFLARYSFYFTEVVENEIYPEIILSMIKK